MNADGSGQTQLTFPGPGPGLTSGYDPAISPDGTRIAFSRDDAATGFQGIWVINVDGGGLHAITTGSATVSDFSPDWSPDGTRLAFSRYDGTHDELFRVNSDGTGEAQITDNTNVFDYFPAYSPDGTRLVFERDPMGGAFRQRLPRQPWPGSTRTSPT